MKKVLIYIPTLAGGGAEKNVYNIACNLASEFSIVLVLNKYEAAKGDSIKDNIKIYTLTNTLTAKCPLLKLVKLRNLLIKISPDVVLTTLPQASAIMNLALLTINNKVYHFIRVANNLNQWRFSKSYLKKIYSFAIIKLMMMPKSHFISVSLGVTRQIFEQYGTSKKINTVSNGLMAPPSFFSAFKVPRGERIISVGRLEYQKDYILLVDSYNAYIINCKSLNIKPKPLYIYGNGSMHHEILERASRFGITDFVNIERFRNSIFDEYEKACVLISTSRYEGFPNVLVEAKCSGLRIVSTDCDFGPSEIVTAGYGVLVKERNPLKIAKALGREVQIFSQMTEQEITILAHNAQKEHKLSKQINAYSSLFKSKN